MYRKLRRMVSSFLNEYAKAVSLCTPASKAEGAVTGVSAIQLPEAPPSSGLKVLVFQSTGAVTNSGTIIGKIQQCDTSGGSYEDVFTFDSVGASGYQFAYVTITKQFVKWIGTVSGTSGTVITSAGMVY